MVPRDGKAAKAKIKKPKTNPGADGDTELSSGRKNRKKIPLTEGGSESPSLSDSSQIVPIQTLSGGVSLIFSMARRMLLWDEEVYYQQHWNDASPTPDSGSNIPPLPKWHPYDGIADLNPSFRSEAPVMNNEGYAQTIRRNSRKKGKASLWRYALRTYYKMKEIELEQAEQKVGNNPDHFMIQRQTEHYEAVLVACGKLGLFREAMRIYQDVLDMEEKEDAKVPSPILSSNITENRTLKRVSRGELDMKTQKDPIRPTKYMIISLIKSCVRQKDCSKDEKLSSLDTVRDMLLSLKEKKTIPVESIMVNPIAAAYAKLGHVDKAAHLIHVLLPSAPTVADAHPPQALATVKRKTSLVNSFNDVQEEPIDLNIYAVDQSKDRSSYNILIEGAISEGNYALAVEQLKEMTRSGYYPNGRSLNAWNK
jgi:pentatricopeptide repeat protein